MVVIISDLKNLVEKLICWNQKIFLGILAYSLVDVHQCRQEFFEAPFVAFLSSCYFFSKLRLPLFPNGKLGFVGLE